MIFKLMDKFKLLMMLQDHPDLFDKKEIKEEIP